MLDRTGVIDWPAHKADPSAHHPAHSQVTTSNGGGGTGVHTVQADVDQPDLLGTQLVRLLHVHEDWAPNGVKVITALVDTGEVSTYSVTYQIRSDPVTVTDTIVVVATAASLKEETSIIINAVVPVDSYIYGLLPATDVNKVGLEINFTII